MPTPLDSQLQEQVDHFLHQSAAEMAFYQQVAGAVGRERARRDVRAMVALSTRNQRLSVVARVLRRLRRIRQRKHAVPDMQPGIHTEELVIAVNLVADHTSLPLVGKEERHDALSDDTPG